MRHRGGGHRRSGCLHKGFPGRSRGDAAEEWWNVVKRAAIFLEESFPHVMVVEAVEEEDCNSLKNVNFVFVN